MVYSLSLKNAFCIYMIINQYYMYLNHYFCFRNFSNFVLIYYYIKHIIFTLKS